MRERFYPPPHIQQQIIGNFVLLRKTISRLNPDSDSVSGDKSIPQGNTYNLMDYSLKTPNNLLRKYQWHTIHNPRISLFGGEEEEVSEEKDFFSDILSVFSWFSKKTHYVTTVGVSAEAKAGLIGVGTGNVYGIYLGFDPLGNYAIVTTRAGFLHFLEKGINIVEESDVGPDGGSWFAGFSLGFSFDFAIRDPEKYQHVMHLKSKETSFDFDLEALVGVDLSFIMNVLQEWKGIEVSIGPGVGIGWGILDANSIVFAFSPKDAERFDEVASELLEEAITNYWSVGKFVVVSVKLIETNDGIAVYLVLKEPGVYARRYKKKWVMTLDKTDKDYYSTNKVIKLKQ